MKRFISSDSRRDFYILYTLVFGIISFFIYWQFEGNGSLWCGVMTGSAAFEFTGILWTLFERSTLYDFCET